MFSCTDKKEEVLRSKKRILFVVTSHSKLGKTGKSTGAYIGEVTHPYEVFTDAGYEIDFVSPKGGKTPLDGMDALDEVSQKYLADKSFMAKLNSTKKPTEVSAADYSAVFYAGGHGTMFDLPDDEDLKNLSSSVYESGGVVSAVCHGPASLVNLKIKNGRYLISGKKVTGFTNEEESAVGLTDAMPFLLEDKLKERGGVYSKASKFKKHVVVSERLVTGQNPASARGVAEEVLKLL
jgi:putative intracellular protease/amidase